MSTTPDSTTTTPPPVTKGVVKKDAQYRVELAQAIDLFGRRVYPGHELNLRGDLLLTHWAAVRHAYPV